MIEQPEWELARLGRIGSTTVSRFLVPSILISVPCVLQRRTFVTITMARSWVGKRG